MSMRGSAMRPLWLASIWEFRGITVLLFLICTHTTERQLMVHSLTRPVCQA